MASFGSHNGEFNIDLCSNGIIYYFSNINLDGQQTKAFLPFPGNNRDDMINHDVPYGWLESTGLIEESRTVDIREFFWRAGSLDATTGYLEDQGEIPAYNGLKYNFMEVNYAGELEDDLNGDLVELTYGFKSEFPCTGYKSVELSCDSGPDEAMIKCWNNDGTERVSVSGSERCGTFLNDVGDCGGDMLESNISNILEDVCVGMMELGLRDIRTQYGFEQYMTEEDCEIILPE